MLGIGRFALVVIPRWVHDGSLKEDFHRSGLSIAPIAEFEAIERAGTFF